MRQPSARRPRNRLYDEPQAGPVVLPVAERRKHDIGVPQFAQPAVVVTQHVALRLAIRHGRFPQRSPNPSSRARSRRMTAKPPSPFAAMSSPRPTRRRSSAPG